MAINEKYLPNLPQKGQGNFSALQDLMNSQGNPGAMGNANLDIGQMNSGPPGIANASLNANANPNMNFQQQAMGGPQGGGNPSLKYMPNLLENKPTAQPGNIRKPVGQPVPPARGY
jgi:hypothetical protein